MRIHCGNESCIALQFDISLESYETKEIVINLGEAENKEDAETLALKYEKIENVKNEYENVKKYWQDLLQTIQVETPDEETNIMLNGWIAYQAICSRLYARTGFYQSGGAYGFRDQLQDTIGVKFLNSNFMKNQIIKHSSHQFIEGDVEHWWHDETKRGIRTRFSDDLLWLPYVVLEYIDFTNDLSILDIETPFIKGENLNDEEDEKYDIHIQSEEKASIYSHCIKAIDKSINFGKNNLPKIGSGDWNDGMNTVGNKGEGESVWLGFFLYDILNRFTRVCMYKDDKYHENEYNEKKNILYKSLNTISWDGNWYRRAFTDNGEILGTIENEECRIDGISQSWAVISGAGEKDKCIKGMENLEKYLVDKENGIIKLLDPPFEKSSLEPGYIKNYLPGIRENGGQYTHVCCYCGQFYIGSQIIAFWRCWTSFRKMLMYNTSTLRSFLLVRLAKITIL